jgi:hypothetical protein
MSELVTELVTVAKADWDNLADHRNQLESIVSVTRGQNEQLINRLNEEVAISAALKTRLESIKSLFGIGALEQRIIELEEQVARLDATKDDAIQDLLHDTITEYMRREFNIEEHLDDVHDWSRYIDVEDEVRDAVGNLTFTVEVS